MSNRHERPQKRRRQGAENFLQHRIRQLIRPHNRFTHAISGLPPEAEKELVLLQLIPVVLSLLFLGAHFFRAGATYILPVIIVLLALLLVRKPWTACGWCRERLYLALWSRSVPSSISPAGELSQESSS